MDKDDPNICQVCGAHKFSHEDLCKDCKEHRRITTEKRRVAARNRQFGPIF